MSENKNAELKLPDGKIISLPVITGTENENAIDIVKLRAQTNYITLDSGYGNTGSCTSAITYLDGEAGILRYRGYPIEELAQKSTFIETSYLLIYGELPTKKQLEDFSKSISRHTLIHEDMKHFYDGFPRNAHPMAILSSVVCASYTFYQEWEDPKDINAQDQHIIKLLAKLPTLVAFSYKKSIGQPFIYPDNSLSYCANFLNMMFATPAEDYFLDPDIVSALDLLLILHADHEQNCSTSTVRMVGSSLSNLYASIAAGIAALWGPRHGGANQKVIEMLQYIVHSGGNVKKFVEEAKKKDANNRLMGFGHRVYKNYDPRATILKNACSKVLAKIPLKDPLFEVAQELEQVALNDSYFIERKLYPNVDFYSGIIYSALGIPVNGFTVMFALGRLPGWIAQWKELINSSDSRIDRPRQIYVGATKRPYVNVEDRAK
ncbi:MAG: citrate synthase [Proteobacteria bacterium]|nr:citrate synthase [Pseudomonadota bacterium]